MMRMLTKHTVTQLFKATVVASLALLFVPTVALAIDPIQNLAVPSPLTDYTTASDGSAAAYYLVFLWRTLIFIGGLAVIVYFLQGAFEWISANGEAAKIATARNKMTGALTGFIVLIGIFVIIQFLEGIFGINILNQEIPTATPLP
jgi:hypothetical protein